MSEVISFAAFQSKRAGSDAPLEWTNSERAELYRVEAVLHQSGIVIETDEGVSDEGDPWFVFCRADGEVLIHIARVERLYSFHSPALAHPLKGRSFSELCAVFQELFPLRVAVRKEETNVLLHPAAILSLVVGTIFLSFDEMLSTRAEAATLDAARGAMPVVVDHEAPVGSSHEAATVEEYHKAVEQFQTLAAKNLKAVLGGRVESTQSQAYTALTTSLLIFAAGGLDAAAHTALADEAKAELHRSTDLAERHDEAASVSFDIGVARDNDHASPRLASFEDAKVVGGHLVFGEIASGKQQAEAETAIAAHRVESANALVQFDFSPHLKPDEIGGAASASHDRGGASIYGRVSPWETSGSHLAEGSRSQGIDPLASDEAKSQSQTTVALQSSEAEKASGGTSDRVAIPSSHDGTAAARADTVEVLLASLPDTLSSNLHFSKEPVKFMLEEWDKIDFGKNPESEETGRTTDDVPPSDPESGAVPDTSHPDSLSEKLTAVELALYDKVVGYQAGGNLSHFDLEAKSQILQFVAKATDIDIIVSDHVIMFVDEAVHASAGATPYMKIWETGDGEAISIVGVTDPSHPTLA